jgi:hypothetical protein
MRTIVKSSILLLSIILGMAFITQHEVIWQDRRTGYCETRKYMFGFIYSTIPDIKSREISDYLQKYFKLTPGPMVYECTVFLNFRTTEIFSLPESVDNVVVAHISKKYTDKYPAELHEIIKICSPYIDGAADLSALQLELEKRYGP